MITCMGLIVGIIETANRNDLAKQCLKWLATKPHLLNAMPMFCVENVEYMQLKDYVQENNVLAGYFQFHDGDVKVVEV